MLSLLRALLWVVVIMDLLWPVVLVTASYGMRQYEVANQAATDGPRAPGRFKKWLKGARIYFVELGVTIFLSLIYPLGWFDCFRRINRDRDKSKPPVLLVHGYSMNRSNWWPLLRRLRRSPELGYLYTINLRPMFGRIERIAERLGRKLDTILAETGQPQVNIVAHSMGGLVTRLLLVDPARAARVGRVVTIATPHNGTRSAVAGAGANTRQMKPVSLFIPGLNGQPLPAGVRFTHLFSPHDNIVIPPALADWERAQTRHELSGRGHLTLLVSPETAQFVTRALTE